MLCPHWHNAYDRSGSVYGDYGADLRETENCGRLPFIYNVRRHRRRGRAPFLVPERGRANNPGSRG